MQHLENSDSINSVYASPDTIQTHADQEWTRCKTQIAYQAHFVEYGDLNYDLVLIWDSGDFKEVPFSYFGQS